jgi:hypothetical protein
MKQHRGRFLASVLLSGLLALVARAQPAFSNAVSAGTVSFSALDQASGLVASRVNPGVLWTHNDAGDSARIFAIDTQGNRLGTYTLSGGSHVDYEDIGTGPGPVTNVQYLFVGDIGDNNASRSKIVIYQVPEPPVYLRQASNTVSAGLKGVRAVALVYPDGPRDAEAMLVDPLSGDVFIVSKGQGVSRVYTVTKAQLDAGGTNTLSFVREIFFDEPSGGAVSPDGREIILRQEDYAQLWTREPGESIGDALGRDPVWVPVVGRTTEPNGEAVCFDAEGRGYFTVSDGTSSQPLYYFGRATPHSADSSRELVGAGTTWRYLDTGTNLGTAWRTNAQAAGVWDTGHGQFGYGDGDEETVVSFGSRSKNKYVTTYFQRQFVAGSLAFIYALELRLVFDDGAAVFLNGAPVALVNLASNAVHTNFATAAQESLEDAWFSFNVDPALLVAGTNLLAVEMHQVTTNSADLSFDLQLVARERTAIRIVSQFRRTDGAFELAFTAGGTNAVIESSTNLLHWAAAGTVPVAANRGVFVDAAATNAPPMFYRVRQ